MSDTGLATTVLTRQLGKRYGSLWAARDISLEVQPGEIYGLLGPNGAGKTTTLRMIAGLLQPDEGDVSLGGRHPHEEPIVCKRMLGFLTGNTGLYERLTALELLHFFGKLHDIDKKTRTRRIEELVEELGLGDFAGRPCGTLSTGQKQRVNIARTLLHQPQVLILDEPTSGLDIISAEFILRIVMSCRDQGKTILFSTHILAEVELLCDRIGVINKGRLVCEGELSQLLKASQTTKLAEAFLTIIKQTQEGQPFPLGESSDAEVSQEGAVI